MNLYEEELIEVITSDVANGQIAIISDSVSYFKNLAAIYPFLGAKIDWALVSGAIELCEGRSGFQEKAFSEFFYEIGKKISQSETIIYVGDGLTDFALLSKKDVFGKYLGAIFSIPQHHYFIGEDFSWCMVFTFEGDMSFGTMK